MNKIDQELFNEVRSVTGLTDESLLCVAGTVYTTIFIGKIPSKDDLSAYLGYSKRTITRLLHELTSNCVKLDNETILADWLRPYLMTLDRPRLDQVIYPLATNFVITGIYIGKGEEPFERAMARSYLQTLFFPQTVQEYETFAGLNILLEYLWTIACGSDESIDDFCHSRFETGFYASAKANQFIDLIYDKNPHLSQLAECKTYSAMANYLTEGLKKSRVHFKERGSAKIAKERLKNMKATNE